MGLHVRPVGPLTARTYWGRRALLLVPLLLVLLLVRACTGGGDAPDDQLAAVRVPASTPAPPAPSPLAVDPTAGTPAPAPAAAPGTPAPAPGTPAPGAPGAPVPGAPVPGVPVPAAACAPGALELLASTDAKTYPTAASPRLTLTVRNVGAVPCAAPLGQGAVELEVTSGPDRVWSSDDCDPGGGVDPLELAPGQAEAVAVTWSGTRSLPGCPGDREQATAGTYRLVGRAGELSSAPAVFTLT